MTIKERLPYTIHTFIVCPLRGNGASVQGTFTQVSVLQSSACRSSKLPIAVGSCASLSALLMLFCTLISDNGVQTFMRAYLDGIGAELGALDVIPRTDPRQRSTGPILGLFCRQISCSGQTIVLQWVRNSLFEVDWPFAPVHDHQVVKSTGAMEAARGWKISFAWKHCPGVIHSIQIERRVHSLQAVCEAKRCNHGVSYLSSFHTTKHDSSITNRNCCVTLQFEMKWVRQTDVDGTKRSLFAQKAGTPQFPTYSRQEASRSRQHHIAGRYCQVVGQQEGQTWLAFQSDHVSRFKISGFLEIWDQRSSITPFGAL